MPRRWPGKKENRSRRETPPAGARKNPRQSLCARLLTRIPNSPVHLFHGRNAQRTAFRRPRAARIGPGTLLLEGGRAPLSIGAPRLRSQAVPGLPELPDASIPYAINTVNIFFLSLAGEFRPPAHLCSISFSRLHFTGIRRQFPEFRAHRLELPTGYAIMNVIFAIWRTHRFIFKPLQAASGRKRPATAEEGPAWLKNRISTISRSWRAWS